MREDPPAFGIEERDDPQQSLLAQFRFAFRPIAPRRADGLLPRVAAGGRGVVVTSRGAATCAPDCRP